ncbi:hypothetical protein ACET3Z_004625 [Daucus carota]
MTFVYLSDLKGDEEDWVIRVRVCRMWESISTKDGSLLSMDMILADEKSPVITVMLKVHMHCEPSAQVIKKRIEIERMKGSSRNFAMRAKEIFASMKNTRNIRSSSASDINKKLIYGSEVHVLHVGKLSMRLLVCEDPCLEQYLMYLLEKWRGSS